MDCCECKKYLSHTGRETGMKYKQTMEALQHRASTGDIIGGKEGKL